MLSDNAHFKGPSDLVVENVSALPSNPEAYRMVYLTAQQGAVEPGLYVYSAAGLWTLVSTSSTVSD